MTCKFLVAPALLLLASSAFGQALNNRWAEFLNQTTTRLVVATGLGATDPEEKDYAFGDLDRDGDLDLVCVRKEPVASLGKRVNVLFMNEGIRDGRAIDGVLVDRTSLYAQASDVAGDLGFNTATNDRDVEIADVDNDGWPDVLTSTTLSDGDPKHISHPRVYMNLGNNGSGQWLGLRHEDSRIPQFRTIPGNLAVAPRFCDMAVGDVTGDGFVDAYHTDYDSTETNIPEVATNDTNDRLLVNNGAGVFTDSLQTRMSSAMLSSAFGMACEIADMNGDGFRDVVKDTALGSPQYVSIAYNNPANVGFFNIFQNNVNTGAPYHIDVGDLNNDNRLDVVVSDDGQDVYRFNTGNDALGRVIWGSNFSFTNLSGWVDNQFAGSNEIVDLDNDGWNDVIIADVDVDVPGCSRRCHVYHNAANAPNVTLREEAEFNNGNTGAGWKGAVGLTSSSLTGTFDVAAFDLTGDGWKDMVIGRCTGTGVWINKPLGLTYYGIGTPWTGGQIWMTANRVPKVNTPSFELRVKRAPPNSSGLIVVSDQQDLAGTLVPALGAIVHVGLATPNIAFFPVATDANGDGSFPIALPNLPALAGFRIFMQAGVAEGALLRTSNGLDLTIQP